MPIQSETFSVERTGLAVDLRQVTPSLLVA